MPRDRSFRAVVADDEEIILRNIARKIEAADGRFTVVGTALNGRDALDLVDAHYPDLLVTDVRMPVMDGLELIASVSTYHPYVKVIIVSGHDDFEFARRAMRYGVKNYILKPVKPDELREVLADVGAELEEDDDIVAAHVRCGAGAESEEIVSSIERFMRGHFRAAVDLEALARSFALSPSQMCKLFRKYRDDTPVRYLMRLRMNEAKRLLIQLPELEIKAVGELVGYPDQFYFSRTFKREAGSSPTEFREREIGK
jgi:Response regulator containing CheY-like receiver domain and AraC-type DNA-binding domain